ncbi:MAG: S8 family peptidase [Chloroflexi bacterium]|nr:S8 family peptidase [Chloroflexota bacterium]
MDRIGPIDGIGKRDAELVRNASHIGVGAQKAKETKSNEPEDMVSIGKLKFKNSDLNNQGKLGIIVSTEDKAKLERIKKLISKSSDSEFKSDLKLIKGISAEVNPDSNVLKKIGEMGEDVKVYVDGKVSVPQPPPMKNGEVGILLDTATKTLSLDKLWEQGITGKGVTIAVIDTGIAQHPDIKDRIIGFKDFVNDKKDAYDDQGHGTHCSGIAAGSGKSSGGKYTGAAPEASLVGVKVLDGNGSGSFSDVIKGIQWAVDNKEKYDIKVISMSLGGSISESYKDDPVVQAVEAAVKKGIVTVVAAGNSGPSKGSIGTPGNAPDVITVGALDDKGTVKHDDDSVASFSSRGPTKYDNIVKPDVLAPGVNITAPNADNDGYISHSGTSMATPMTAGVAALLVQTKPGIKPLQIKEALMKTADKVRDYDENTQGAGLIDPQEALKKLA